jgi:hypothetical protein
VVLTVACRSDCDACANGATYGHQSANGARPPGPAPKACPVGIADCAMCALGYAHRTGIEPAGVRFEVGVQEPARLAASGPPPGKRPRGAGEPCCEALAPGGVGHCACDPRWTSLAPAAPAARLVLGVRSPGDWADETD